MSTFQYTIVNQFTLTLKSDSTAVHWEESTGLCSFVDANSRNTNVTCSKPGLYIFTVYRNNNISTADSFYITVKDLDLQWFYQFLDQKGAKISEIKSNVKIRIWIYDPLLLSPLENNALALNPSIVLQFNLEISADHLFVSYFRRISPFGFEIIFTLCL